MTGRETLHSSPHPCQRCGSETWTDVDYSGCSDCREPEEDDVSGTLFDSLPPEEQIKRLRNAIETLVYWLYQSGCGIGAHDVRGIEALIERGPGAVDGQ